MIIFHWNRGTLFSDKEFLQMSLVQTVLTTFVFVSVHFLLPLCWPIEAYTAHRLEAVNARTRSAFFAEVRQSLYRQGESVQICSRWWVNFWVVTCRYLTDLDRSWQILTVDNLSSTIHILRFLRVPLEVLWSLPKGIGRILYWTQSRSGEASGFHDPGLGRWSWAFWGPGPQVRCEPPVSAGGLRVARWRTCGIGLAKSCETGPEKRREDRCLFHAYGLEYLKNIWEGLRLYLLFYQSILSRW